MLRGRWLHVRLLRGLRLRHRRPWLRRGRRLHVLLRRRLLRLRGRGFWGRWRGGRRWLLRRRRFWLRLTRFLLLRVLLLLREDHGAVLTRVRRQEQAERERRDNRSGKQNLLRPCHLVLVLQFFRLGLGRAHVHHRGRQWCVLIMTK